MVIIATDGVNDSTRGWTTDVSLRPQVRVLDTGFCAQFRSNNATLGIINTPYYPMPWDWGYAATLDQPAARAAQPASTTSPSRCRIAPGSTLSSRPT
jgi:hypothetical protein